LIRKLETRVLERKNKKESTRNANEPHGCGGEQTAKRHDPASTQNAP
jgi:hypothetical protein